MNNFSSVTGRRRGFQQRLVHSVTIIMPEKVPLYHGRFSFQVHITVRKIQIGRFAEYYQLRIVAIAIKR